MCPCFFTGLYFDSSKYALAIEKTKDAPLCIRSTSFYFKYVSCFLRDGRGWGRLGAVNLTGSN